MPALQTTYNTYLPIAHEGQRANLEAWNSISRTVETAAGIGFGKVVVQGAGDHGVILPDATHTAFIGITVRDQAADAYDPNGVGYAPNLYLQNRTAGVMTFGCIYVIASVQVAVGDPAFFVPATGLITNVSTNNIAIPRSRFDTSASASTLAILRIS